MNNLRAMRKKNWSEKKSVIYVILILISVCLLAAVIVIWKLKSFSAVRVCTTEECVNSSFFLLDLLDLNVNPCDNFYNFTCGNYKGHLLVHNFQNEIDRRLRNFIISPIQEHDSRSVKLQKQYYQACKNVSGIEEDQNRTLKKLYEALGGWPVLNKRWNEKEFKWGRIVEKCKDIGFYYDWFINVKNHDETISDNRLYITVPENVNEVEDSEKKRYMTLMTNVAVLMGAPGNLTDISESMARVMEFEIGLLKIIEDTQLNATDVEYTMNEIKYKYPDIPWTSLLKYVPLSNNEKILFNIDSYIPQLEAYLNKTDKRVQADYIFWKLTESFSTLLTHVIRKKFEAYADFSKHYKFFKNRESYCYGITTTVFAYVSEAEFVRTYAAEKESIKDMVDKIISVLHKHIENVKWMNEVVKNVAFSRIQNMTIIIGGPEEMYDEEGFDKFLGTDQIDLFGLSNTIDIILEVDRSRDLFNLDFRKPKLNIKQAQLYQGVSSLGFIKYIPDENIMFLPAAALDGIFYSSNRVSYLNYGAIGTIIGHELAHGFGLMGNLGLERVLKKNDTLEQFLEAAKCLIEDCNNIGIENSINIHCRKTFEENFADYVGVNLAYEAYKQVEKEDGKESILPGLNYTSAQLFWVIYSSIMCSNVDVNNTEGLIHMLPFQRILGAFRNSEYFAKDFNCLPGSGMNPVVKCKVL